MYDNNPIFEISCLIRPIKAFHPRDLLEANTDNFRLFLTSNTKLMWFHQYCAEQGISGVVNTQFLKSEVLKDVPDSEFAGSVVSPVKEYWTATVIMNGNEVSKATSSGTFLVNDRTERDSASNQLRKYAIGAALSQAGFGIVDSFDMSTDDIQRIMIAANPQETPLSQPGATQPKTDNTPAPVPAVSQMQDSFFGMPAVQSTPASAVLQQPTFPSPHPVSVTTPPPAPQVDPIMLAKQVVWNGSGPMKGLTLGEVLSNPGGVRNIEWIANNYTPKSEAGRQAKEAAKLILGSIATGK